MAATQRGEQALLVPFVVTGVRACHALLRPDARGGLVGARSRTKGSSGWARGSVALEHGEGLLRLAGRLHRVGARCISKAAILGWAALVLAWYPLLGRLHLAACLIRSNRHAYALPVLRAVKETAEQLDSPPLRDRCEDGGKHGPTSRCHASRGGR